MTIMRALMSGGMIEVLGLDNSLVDILTYANDARLELQRDRERLKRAVGAISRS